MRKTYLFLLFFCTYLFGFGQKNAIVYELPAPTVEKIDSLLKQQKPTYVRICCESTDTLCLRFSFEKESIITEYRRILRTGKRFLKIKKTYYPVLFLFDRLFYSNVRHYNHTFRLFSTLDVYIDLEGNFLKSRDWRLESSDE